MTTKGVVINVHQHGATVRLDDGTLAAVPSGELAAHRPAYVASLQKRSPLDLALERSGRHAVVFLTAHRPATPTDSAGSEPNAAPVDDGRDGQIVRTLHLVEPSSLHGDPLFEHRMAEYLKSTEEWAPADRPPPDERHLVRKKKRAAFFDARTPKRQPPA